MIADPAAYPAIFAVPGAASRSSDPVRARVAAPPQLTNYQILQANSADPADTRPANRGLRLLVGRGTGRPRGPHPGDILYWVACLGGACLLLLAATT